MSFLYPNFLYALLLLAIPVIIHLFNFRKYKKYFFTNVRFLKEIKQETQSRNRLRHLLVLLARMFALAALIFAFAQPYLPVADQSVVEGEKTIGIYVDNSFSMDAIGANGRLLDEAKRKATEIASAYKPSDRFTLLTSDFHAAHHRLLSRDVFIEMVAQVEISSSVRMLSETIERLSENLRTSASSYQKSYIISDFQKTICDFQSLNIPLRGAAGGFNVSLIPLQPLETKNLFIDSCWFTSPLHQLNQPEILQVRVWNHSDDDYENIPLKLLFNGMQKSIATISVKANSSSIAGMSYTITEPVIHHGEVSLTDHPVTFDDNYYFSFSVASLIPVLCINNESTSNQHPAPGSQHPAASTQLPPIPALFSKDSGFFFTETSDRKIDYSLFNTNRVVILNGLEQFSSGFAQEIEKFVRNGGSLVVFPSPVANLESYRLFLETKLGISYFTVSDTAQTKTDALNTNHFIFNDVFVDIPKNIDLPIVYRHYTTNRKTKSTEQFLLMLVNGDFLAAHYTVDKGNVYLFTVPLDDEFSNLSKHSIFVTMMYKIAMQSQQQENLFYVMGDNITATASGEIISKEQPLHITGTGKSTRSLSGAETSGIDVIPEYRITGTKVHINLHDQISKSGNYLLVSGVSAKDLASEGARELSGIALNYERKESDLSQFTPDELSGQIKEHGLTNIQILDLTTGNEALSIAEIQGGKKMWKICIILALVFLGIEGIFIKYLRK